MLSELQVVNISQKQNPPSNWEDDTFVLSTCQRHLYLNTKKNWDVCTEDHLTYSPSLFQGPDAYRFLLETLCGLQSQIQGENEIAAQFKDTFNQYLNEDKRNPQVLKIIQKLFQDAKEVRTKHLKGLGQRSYASIARNLITKNDHTGPVLVLGSGQLALDLIFSLKKRFEVHLSARNPDKLQSLCEENSLEAVEWKNFADYKNYSAIISAIGCDHKILNDENLFSDWQKRHGEGKTFIDFGSPSIIETQLDKKDKVFDLNDILSAGALQNQERQQKIEAAKLEIEDILRKRTAYFTSY